MSTHGHPYAAPAGQSQQRAPDASPSADNAASSDTTNNQSATSQASAEAARAIEATREWKPSFARQQSWNKEDQKRELQMSQLGDVRTGPGFTERG